MILGANGSPLPSTSAEAEAEVRSERMKGIMQEVVKLFVEHHVTFAEGADIGGNLLINYITAAADLPTAKQVADHAYRQLGTTIQQVLQTMSLHEQVRTKLGMPTPQVPS